CCILCSILFFFFTVTPTTEFYTLSLHDALPIYSARDCASKTTPCCRSRALLRCAPYTSANELASATINTKKTVLEIFPILDLTRSEEHTSELQSRGHLVCRLLLEKKKNYLCQQR